MANSTAFCIKHEDREATASCERCGDTICNECVQDLFNHQVCPNCHKNYGGNLLSDFQASLWGKRDNYVCFIGGAGSLFFSAQALFWFVMALFNLWGGNSLIGVTEETLSIAFFFTLPLVITGPYLLLKRWARKALFLFPVIALFVASAQVANLSIAVGICFIFVLLPLILLIVAYKNPQNKLAFKMDISTDELETLYEAKKSNRAAHNAFALSLLAFFIPPLLFLSLHLARRGRKNCDPEAWPPIGGMKTAQKALKLTTLGFLLWTMILIYSVWP
ncbi:MAG: hypothetical protein P1V97_01770 [Planctomycetota bacterium]|nr:hypothetical protein [Planctomycetota bacterium]